jgi:peptidylprolyl isomerase
VATSRRRERELARRRFERRRQAEMERRARAKRRNTVVGAVVGTIVLLAAVVGGGFAIFDGSSKPKPSAVKPAATPSTSPTAAPAPPAPKRCAKIKPNPPAKGEPRIPDVNGKAPTKLVTKDIKVGHGPAAKSGDNIIVKYVGVACSTGQVFDASYTDPVNTTTKKHDFPLALGKGQVIPGWDQGLVGMKAGGVRELIIPASLAYGSKGQGSIKGNETLIFVVTMVKV